MVRQEARASTQQHTGLTPMPRRSGGLAVELDGVVCGNEMLSCATNKTNIIPIP